MQNRLIHKTLLSVVFISAIIIVSFFSSCKKNANNQFLGTYPGKLVLVVKGDTTLDTLAITAGTSGNSILLEEKAHGASATATVNANKINIPSQTVVVKGGGIYPLTGTGTLNGKTLTLNLSEEINGVFVNSVFTGTRQ
jgi:hypothetical protein